MNFPRVGVNDTYGEDKNSDNNGDSADNDDNHKKRNDRMHRQVL